jgi:hypothetical protein
LEESTELNPNGFAHVNVGVVSTNNGKVDEFRDKQVGGFLSKSKAHTVKAMQMLLQEDKRLVNQGAGATSVKAQSASAGTSHVKLQNTEATTEAKDEGFAALYDSEDAFVEFLEKKHNSQFHRSALKQDPGSSKPKKQKQSEKQVTHLVQNLAIKQYQHAAYRALRQAIAKDQKAVSGWLKHCLESTSSVLSKRDWRPACSYDHKLKSST